MRWFKRKTENRADMDTSAVDAVLLQALLGTSVLDKQYALAIPSVSSSITHMANTISSLPIKLYKKVDGKVEEVVNDDRVKLLNKDMGDTLTATQAWKAMLEDYFMGKGAFLYINKVGNSVKSLHYVDETNVSINKNTDPIFKDYDILVQGRTYMPYEFVKFFRKTKDGCTNISITSENSLMLAVAYYMLKYENNLVQTGGNKKGFLKSENKLDQPTIDDLKASWKNLYSSSTENVVVLNKGLDFTEASNTSVEMQLNEQKITNSSELSMLFSMPNSIIRGNATENDTKNYIKDCIIPTLTDFECSLDRDLLLESEKDTYYFAFDTKELTRGSIKERYEAYQIGLNAGFLQVDEVRKCEDWESLGMEFVKIGGLDSIFYNPETGMIYIPNTKETANMNDKAVKAIDLQKGGV